MEKDGESELERWIESGPDLGLCNMCTCTGAPTNNELQGQPRSQGPSARRPRMLQGGPRILQGGPKNVAGGATMLNAESLPAMELVTRGGEIENFSLN